ncbi:MAG: dTMP kinase [Longimicrobiales bacterium]|nr:dTMP kinase [Longimicrobiales bacterium]
MSDADRRDGSLFIVLEGGDGAGKTTQVALLSAWFDALGLAHVSTREPGGTPVGEAIRSIVLAGPEMDMPAESELMLILAARAAFIRDVVRPALEDGHLVLADRFSLSTMAYQGYGRGLDLDQVREAISIATGGLSPDLYLVLDLPAAEGEERQKHDGAEPDRIEAAGRSFRDAVREAYLELAASEPGVEVVSARGTPEDVHSRIKARLAARFPGTFPDRV